MKILLSVGSMVGRKFTRFFKLIDDLCKEGILNGEDIIAQTGWENYKSEYYETFDIRSDEEFKKIIESVDIVICHAGTGTVTYSLKKGKIVILFPRLSKFNEHYDNHQLELCELFTQNGYTMCATSREELIECINNILTFKPKTFKSNNKMICSLIDEFISNC